MRPKSIIHAERIYAGSLLLLVIGAVVDWSALVEMGGAALAIGSTAFFIGAYLLLLLFALRRGSRVARGLLAAITALSTVSMLWQIWSAQVAVGPVGAINVAQLLLMVVGTVLLFRPNAAAWFARPHDDWEEDGEPA